MARRTRTINAGPVSAYGIAVANGFEGSEQQWLESLKSGILTVRAELNYELDEIVYGQEDVFSLDSTDVDNWDALMGVMWQVYRDETKTAIITLSMGAQSHCPWTELTFYKMENDRYVAPPMYNLTDILEIHFYELRFVHASGTQREPELYRFVMSVPID